jgi:hypothetical protein
MKQLTSCCLMFFLNGLTQDGVEVVFYPPKAPHNQGGHPKWLEYHGPLPLNHH